MAVNLKANVSKAMVWDVNYVGRSASLYYEGHGHVVEKVSQPCECTVDGFEGKGWHFNLIYEDGDQGCATLANARDNLVA